ncbi:MAG: DUF411 domain-containing protein [Cyanobacteriota bacterium]|nr:DUF411 domain-containing protein [Cyanobacteriota bacterium]
MSADKLLNWRKLAIVGAVIVGITGVGYWAVDRFHENQPIAQLSPQTTPISNASHSTPATEALNITVYRTPTCGCCQGWVDYIEQNNFEVTDIVKPEADIQAIRQKYDLPEQLNSCHTAEINGYLVEGHVLTEDVRQLIDRQPDLAGISVPGMPIGTPGMEMGDRKQSFDVLGFRQDGEIEVLNSYEF